MLTYAAKFQEKYAELNPQQKQAVDTIDGPVMVLAGPGTGKTQILALRICNILIKTDTQPHNILCLTFTDQGAVEMRKRLVSFMGADAYKVHVYTYHAFAKKVIQDNPDYFNNYLLEPLSDIERIQVIREIIDTFQYGHPLHRVKAESKYFDKDKLNGLYQTMKKEGWTIAYLEQAITEQLRYHREEDPDMKYKRKSGNNEKGDLKQGAYDKLESSYMKSLEAIKTSALYTNKLQDRNRFDYADMINWSIEALKKNETIRLDYQEQYLYFLADEFQDSSGTQIEILNLLSQDVEQPNLFVVGDDDQSIYRFQGASMENLAVFHDKYRPELIVLLNNYRSSIPIVESSKKLITTNQSRLTHALKLDKNFIASGDNKDLTKVPQVLQFENVIEEETYIYNIIKRMKEEGRALNEVAILFPQHNIAAELIKVLTKDNIPVQVKRKVDLLKVPYIKNMINVLDLVNKMHKGDYDVDHLIPDLLNLPGFDVDFSEIYIVGRYLSKHRDDNWTDILVNEATIKTILDREESPLIEASKALKRWIGYIADKTTQDLFQHIIEEGGFINQALTANDNYWKLEMLNTLFDYIKDESVKNPDFTIDNLNTQIQIMSENNLSLDFVDVIGDSNGVQFVSCHGSKGMEFDKVFLLGCTDNNWKVKSSNQNYKLPDLSTQSDSDKDSDEEEKRRLFYVAMTRAKQELTFTYATHDTESSSKELVPATYIAEMQDQGSVIFEAIKLDANTIVDYQAKRMTLPTLAKKHWIDETLINNRLENYVMNVTHLNKYINCPITFYFEVILRVSSARTGSMGYGNAIHHAFERYIKEQRNHGLESLGLDRFFQIYEEGLTKFRSHFTKTEFEDYIKHGRETITQYYNTYKAEWHQPKQMYFEETIEHVVINGVPFKGNVDRVDVFEDSIKVFDYKTGTKKSPKVNPPVADKPGSGDQWRQIITYGLLIQASTKFDKPMVEGILDFTESAEGDKLKRAKISPSTLDLEIVADEIKEVYAKIKNHDFVNGCEREYCQWCSFVQAQR